MEENKTIFNYISQVFATYGIIIAIFIILGCIVGEESVGYSSLFEYGNQGFSTATLIQLFAVSVVVSIGQILFLTDKWIKNLSIIIRSALFFVAIIIVIAFFVIAFEWFPVDDPKSWFGFLLSFSVCSLIGVVVGILREKMENEKMDQALDRYRKRRNSDVPDQHL